MMHFVYQLSIFFTHFSGIIIASTLTVSFLLFYSALSLFQCSCTGSCSCGRLLECFGLFQNLGIEFLSSAREDFLDVLSSTCTSFETLVYSLTLCELDCPVKRDFSLIFKFTLVSNEVNTNIFCGVLLNLLEPTPQIVKSLVARDIIGKEYTVCTTIENSRHWFERLLPSLHVEWLELCSTWIAIV